MSEAAAAGVPREVLEAVATTALAEDLGPDRLDVTGAATIPEELIGTADVVARAAGVVAGGLAAQMVFELVGVTSEAVTPDGATVAPGDVVLTAHGRVRDLLAGERSALNLLCHLSGVATLTRRWVDAVEGTGAQVLDTRKTTPGLRVLEKYAVRCGGGSGFRMGLFDAAMVKDNHVVAAGGVAAAYRAVRERFPDVAVEVECDTLEQVTEALAAGADLLLLDNMDLETLRAAVDLAKGKARTEASGGLTLERARAVAGTGVDYLSVGALTHSAPVLDLGFDLRPIGGA